MVFTSIPYLDPANWPQQQQTGNTSTNSGASNSQLPTQSLPNPPQPPPPHGSGSTGSIRPGSMADRARMANIPLPEAALPCPRCESTNTKFCYFNNYNLSQPRHFCKTCRRYWTRGGALRNVPVGGGCRRNQRSKSSSKSPVSSDRQASSSISGNSSNAIIPSNSLNGSDSILGLSPQVPPPLRFMAPLHQLSNDHHQFSAGDHQIGLNYGLNYSTAISTPMGGASDLNFHLGSVLSGGNENSGGIGGGSNFLGLDQQWRIPNISTPPQYPFFGSLGLDPSPGLFRSGGEPPGYNMGQVWAKQSSSGDQINQMNSVKMEENQGGVNLGRQFLGTQGNDQFNNWSSGINAWTDLSGFSSSSNTRNHL